MTSHPDHPELTDEQVARKSELLSTPIEHLDITRHDVRPLVDQMRHMAYSARDLANASDLYVKMLEDRECGVILCLAGSLISAGLKQVFVEMLRSNMVDGIVSTGANIVDQDFFEALGYKHYVAPDEYKSGLFDQDLQDVWVDRIYDTFICEGELRQADDTCRDVANELEPRPYSSREFLQILGKWLDDHGGPKSDSIVYEAYKRDVPIIVPAFSDCSAGFGLIAHQHQRTLKGEPCMSIDSVKDFYELSVIKDQHQTTGLFMIGGGVPKNFAQDVAVSADIFGKEPVMHKYAIQVTVADVRDGALSSSTLKEACSWGKVDMTREQMVFSEATLAVPLIAGYAWHSGAWKQREPARWAKLLEGAAATS